MSEETQTVARPDTVQKFRHAARASLVKARSHLGSFRTAETKAVYNLLNGTIEEIIRGRQGLTQEEQVEHLGRAEAKVNANLDGLPEAVEAAKASVMALLEGWETEIVAQANEARDILAEAKAFAAERDFEAHQEAKRSRRYGGYTPPAYGDAQPEDADEVDDDEDADED